MAAHDRLTGLAGADDDLNDARSGGGGGVSRRGRKLRAKLPPDSVAIVKVLDALSARLPKDADEWLKVRTERTKQRPFGEAAARPRHRNRSEDGEVRPDLARCTPPPHDEPLSRVCVPCLPDSPAAVTPLPYTALPAPCVVVARELELDLDLGRRCSSW